jgi:serine/threonine protein kinase
MQLLSACEMSYGSDVYSFGTIMYELLTFKDAFENLSTSNLLMVSPHAHSKPPSITQQTRCSWIHLEAAAAP